MKAALFSLCQISFFRLLNPRDPHWKRKLSIALGLGLFVLVYLFAYCFFAAKILAEVGLLELLPPAIFTLASLMALMMAIYQVEGIFDDHFLKAFPISKTTRILSQIIPLYLENLTIILVIFMPCLIAIHFYNPLSLAYILKLLFLLVWSPMFPLALGMICGLIIHFISSHFRHHQQITMILTFGLVLGIFFTLFQLQEFKDTTTLFTMTTKLLGRLYPPSPLFINFLIHSDGFALLGYLLLQSGAFLIFLFMITHYSQKQKPLASFQNAQKLKMHSSTLLGSLYKMECRRYLNSVPYLTNTAMSYVLLLAICLYLQFQDLDQLLILLEISKLKDTFQIVLPFFIGLMCGIGTTTACSIALEGKHLWQLKCLPIPTKTIFQAKLLLNATIAVPCILLDALLLTKALNLDWIMCGQLIIIPLLYIGFFSQVGLIGNLYFPHLDWTSEVKAVKQGGATFFVIILSLILGAIPIALLQTTLHPTAIILTLVFILVLGNLMAGIYLFKVGPQRFHHL